jgi:hypothetical protein
MDKFSRLTEKYFEGQTSLKEEQQLRNYYRCGKMTPNLKQYKPIFDYLNEERNISRARKPHAPKMFLHIAAIAAACALLSILVPEIYRLLKPGGNEQESYAYINARKITDINIISLETLNSLENIATDDGFYTLQAEILDMFTKEETKQIK